MKKTIISLALAFLGIANLYAVKAKPGIAKIMLADGTVACATLHGDETFHYYMLLDGTPLRETQDGKYEKITAEELNTRKTRAFSSENITRASEIGTVSPSYFPHKGSPKALVLLVQFQDVKFKSKDPVATFNHYLNGKKGEAMPEADKEVFITNENYCQNYGSVQQYFADMSDNQFIPQFDVVGPVTVSKNSAYYGKNGVDDGSDTNYPQMIKEACQQVNAKVNFVDYDSDGDGYVDLVYVIYAGYSESISGNSSDCLWPKSGTVGGLGTYDGKKEAMPEADKEVFITNENYCQNYGSVQQYFADMSDNQFIPQFDVVGPVTVSKNSAYYGKNGVDDGSDTNYPQMIKEACQQVNAKVNFVDYDSDGDGYVDLVYVIYAGYSESISGNSSDCLWPKSGTVGGLGTYDGKKVCRFGINNELNNKPADTQKGKYYINGIGLFCHEFSHTLGLPDIYPTNGITEHNQSPEYWDVMDMGSYQANGYQPIPYSPWEKSIVGWKQPTLLSDTEAKQIKLEPYDKASDAYKIIANSQGEYLLLQNIRNEGWYKEALGYGLLVWRIDYDDLSSVNLFDNPNNTLGKPRVMIVPADGMVYNSYNEKVSSDDIITSLQNDPFPTYKAGSATEYEVNSLTSITLNNSVDTSHPLYNITKDEATGLVTFDYLKNFSPTGISSVIIGKDSPTAYLDLEGRKVAVPQKGKINITSKGQKIIY